MPGSPVTRASAETNEPDRLLNSALATASSRFFWPLATGRMASISPNICFTSCAPVRVPPCLPYSSPFFEGPLTSFAVLGSQPVVLNLEI